ncbi:Calcium-independent phospholipase A2-gamma [Purpureocillium lavendulum]|uniref:Calcium-independent phospholipase A2-gamma n=1 Tax=Purpureocillium lavendulum TaxID=1247861 RepID=A0AB34FM53_9HYPO|nr:Calcium-independent phospholipase A2-gamma [Purpureocillium lavendulum]
MPILKSKMPSKKGKNNAKGNTSSRQVSQSGKAAAATPTGEQHISGTTTPVMPPPSLPRPGAHSLTPSPLRSAVSYRSIGPSSSNSSIGGGAAVPGSPVPSGIMETPGGVHSTVAAAVDAVSSPPLADFWRLLPMSGGVRRDSGNTAANTANAAGVAGGAVPGGPAPSWLASSPSSSAAATPRPGKTVQDNTPAKPAKAAKPAKRIPPPLTLVGSNHAERVDTEIGGQQQGRDRAQSREGRDEDAGVVLSAEGRFVKRRWEMNSTMHAAVFMAQCLVALAVGCVLLAITIWKHDEVDADLWDNLGTYVHPALVLIFIICGGTLAAHETLVLSTVVMLYLQAAVTFIAMGMSLFAWIWIFSTSNGDTGSGGGGGGGGGGAGGGGHGIDWQLLKGVVVSGVAAVMGTAVFAFMRIAAVWWIVEEKGELGGDVDEFHDFVLVNLGVWDE